MKFSHIALSCVDPITTEQFYTKNFGFRRGRVIPLGGTDQIVFLKNDQNVYLELFKADAELPAPRVDTGDGPHYPAVRHLAFQVDDVEATIAALGDGIDVTLGPLDFGAFIPNWKTVWIRDPDGNIVEISQGYVDEENPPAL